MSEKTVIKDRVYEDERALFGGRDLILENVIFEKGESPLKEAGDLEIRQGEFKYKYPLWYADHVQVADSIWFEMARSGVWYTHHIQVTDSTIIAPKNFRRCKDVTLKNVSFTDAGETLWSCRDVRMEQVVAKGDYFAMNSEDLVIDGLTLAGNYPFDGARNVTIRNSRLISKDAFWNAENVLVENCYIYGEYLGWNSKNLTFKNCTIESTQGLCYIQNLKMENCRLVNTRLAFEYCDVEATITGKVDSVLNPTMGTIRADAIGELILTKDCKDPSKTKIICEGIDKKTDTIDWNEI
ncbi:MAG: DUF3737 family protein [Lachnospiraceae bacterium]|nr:DUF3737 family protein [Lachnospiraceae bacterium]MBQ5484922.1 DUF3737 family protein [Lachnospiraceae bacterium]